MVKSASDLSRDEIRKGLVDLLGESQVCVDEAVLATSSVDRFKKYQAVNGIFLGPIPAAVVAARSTAEVADVLRFANEHRINVVARTGVTSTRRWPRDHRRGLDRARRLVDERDRQDRPGQHDGDGAVRRLSRGARGTPSAPRASRPGTRPSPSLSPRWAASPRPARPVSSRRSTGGSRRWSSASRRCSADGTICRREERPARAGGP